MKFDKHNKTKSSPNDNLIDIILNSNNWNPNGKNKTSRWNHSFKLNLKIIKDIREKLFTFFTRMTNFKNFMLLFYMDLTYKTKTEPLDILRQFYFNSPTVNALGFFSLKFHRKQPTFTLTHMDVWRLLL